MISNVILATGMLLIASFIGGRLANRLKLPRVSGYLCSGLLLSPSVSGILARATVTDDLHVITEISLGIIAYSIGGSLEWRQIRHLGMKIGCITFFQAAGAAVVTSLMLLLTFPHLTGDSTSYSTNSMLAAAIVLGAISAATAPGAVMAIVSELKAKGNFVTLLLGVIALDDAVTIVLFAVASGIAVQLLSPANAASATWASLVLLPAREIGISLLVGTMGGVILKFTALRIERKAEMLMVVMGVILSVTGVSHLLHASALLSAMATGTVAANSFSSSPECFNIIETVEETIFGLFFALAGAYMEIHVLETAWAMAVALLLFRMAGKQAGAVAGAISCRAGSSVKKFLGIALFPQAGVTVGLILLSEGIFPAEIYTLLFNAVIGSVIINELIAPPLVKYALTHAEP